MAVAVVPDGVVAVVGIAVHGPLAPSLYSRCPTVPDGQGFAVAVSVIGVLGATVAAPEDTAVTVGRQVGGVGVPPTSRVVTTPPVGTVAEGVGPWGSARPPPLSASTYSCPAFAARGTSMMVSRVWPGATVSAVTENCWATGSAAESSATTSWCRP